MDFLTVTVSRRVASALLARSELVESGYPKAGFARTELRRTWGGECWRKWEPHQEGRQAWMNQREYESWEASGAAAASLVDQLPDQEHRASRVDVAFDLTCAAECLSDHMIEACRAWVSDRRLTVGIAGEGGVNTHYVGSMSSDKRLRVYRRDLRDPELWDLPTPIMRFEVVLKNEHAASWVKCYQADQLAALATAARCVHDMTGLCVWHVGCELELQRDPLADEVAELFQAVRSAATASEKYGRLGVDFAGLCALMFQSMSRATKSKVERAVRLGLGVDWRAVEESVSSAIERRGLPA